MRRKKVVSTALTMFLMALSIPPAMAGSDTQRSTTETTSASSAELAASDFGPWHGTIKITYTGSDTHSVAGGCGGTVELDNTQTWSSPTDIGHAHYEANHSLVVTCARPPPDQSCYQESLSIVGSGTVDDADGTKLLFDSERSGFYLYPQPQAVPGVHTSTYGGSCASYTEFLEGQAIAWTGILIDAPASALSLQGTTDQVEFAGGYSCGCTNLTKGSVTYDLNRDPLRTLTVSKSGTGSGTVTSSSPGINCGADCSEAYASGTPVTLTATPDTGSVFAGWSGVCSGTSPTCSVTTDSDKSVTAMFAPSDCVPQPPARGKWVASRLGWDQMSFELTVDWCAHDADGDGSFEYIDITETAVTRAVLGSPGLWIPIVSWLPLSWKGKGSPAGYPKTVNGNEQIGNVEKIIIGRGKFNGCMSLIPKGIKKAAGFLTGWLARQLVRYGWNPLPNWVKKKILVAVLNHEKDDAASSAAKRFIEWVKDQLLDDAGKFLDKIVDGGCVWPIWYPEVSIKLSMIGGDLIAPIIRYSGPNNGQWDFRSPAAMFHYKQAIGS